MRKPVSNPVETEAKIRVASFVAIRRRMVSAGGRRLNPRTLETNTLFDYATGSLRARGHSFRVRGYGGQGSVTLKGAPRVEGGLKSRAELETQVESPEMLSRILMSLGLVPLFRYEKFREIWKMGQTAVCLDQTPLGRFVEIEGTSAAIHSVAARLGLSADRFLSASYPALWFEAGRTGDMAFAARKKPATPRAPARTRGRKSA